MARPGVVEQRGERPDVDREAALDLLDGDEGALLAAASVFLAEIGDQVDALRAAVAAGDARGVHASAHRLKGSLSMFGAAPSAELSDRIQRAGVDGRLADAARDLPELERHVEQVVAALRGWLEHPRRGAGP